MSEQDVEIESNKEDNEPKEFEKCRWLIMSDIHSNLEALNAVLLTAKETGYDRIACLGDFVGYGPNPNEVVEWARGAPKDSIFILGNHDYSIANEEAYIEDYNYNARLAVRKQRTMITEETRHFLKNLPMEVVINDLHFIHGSPYQWGEYIHDQIDATYAMPFVKASKCFIGHTHRSVIWKDSFDKPKIINVGSVGQPRDRNPMASFVIYDQCINTLEMTRVEYDIKTVQDKMKKLDISQHLIDRLKKGE